MKKTLEALRALNLIDSDIFAWIVDDSGAKRLLAEGQAPVDYGGVFYKNYEMVVNPIGTVIQLQTLKNNQPIKLSYDEKGQHPQSLGGEVSFGAGN